MTTPKRRLVDQYTSHRTRPMKVICLGASRTGTVGFYVAMNKLGYNCWHLITSFTERPTQDLPLLEEALWLKATRSSTFGELDLYPGDPETKPPPWGRKEWDVILGDYDACADNPVASFVDEMLDAYPEAKVVLTLRDVDAWVESHRSSSIVLVVLAIRCAVGSHNSWALVVPPERLLEFDIREGWEPLCKFLDKPILDEPYPHVNESKDFVKLHAMMWWVAVGKMVLKVGTVGAVPLAGWMCWNRYHR